MKQETSGSVRTGPLDRTMDFVISTRRVTYRDIWLYYKGYEGLGECMSFLIAPVCGKTFEAFAVGTQGRQICTGIQGSTARESRESLENSTELPQRREDVEQRVDVVFDKAVDQDFEDGMESEFSRDLVSLVQEYGNFAMQEIAI